MRKNIFLTIICITILFSSIATSSVISLNLNIAKSNNSFDNNLKVDWEINLGDDLRDYGSDIVKTTDNCFLAVGNYNEGAKGWIVKLGQSGNVLWEKKYGTTDANYFEKIMQINEGYLIGGSSDAEDAGTRKFWVVKIYEDGSVDWENEYGFYNSHDYFLDFTKSNDNGYVLIGKTMEGADSIYNPLIIKIDENGVEEKRVVYDRYPNDPTEDIELYDIDLTSDGGYICAGKTQEPYTGDYEFFLVKLDENLNEEWNTTFDSGSESDNAYDVVETFDGYVMVGEYYFETGGNPHFGAWIVKSDIYGSKVWDNKIQGVNNHASAKFIKKSNDGNFLITGEVGQTDSTFHDDLWVLKIDSFGNEIFSFVYGDKYSDYGSSLVETNDYGIVVIGTIMTEYEGWTFDQDMWVLKLSESTNGNKPDKPSGEIRGVTGEEYEYFTKFDHPELLDIQYGWDWDNDDIVDEWTVFYPSGQTISISYIWESDGAYLIKVKARDANEMESSWSDPLAISMPKTKLIYNNIIFNQIKDRYPAIFIFINRLLDF